MENVLKEAKIKYQKIKDPSVLYLYYFNSVTNFDDFDNCFEETIVIFNINNGAQMNNFLLEYLKKRIINNPELDYEMLRVFEKLDDTTFKETIEVMLPSNLKLTKFIDDKTLTSLSNDYNIPKFLLKKYISERKW